MDSDALREATDRWVAAGVIDADTADDIREFERGRQGDADDENRLVTALSLMGAALVGTGVLLYLAATWSQLSLVTRTVLLIAAPVVAAVAGLGFADGRVPRVGRAPRVGHGLWFLGAAFLGPTLFLLADMHAPGVDTAPLLVLWVCGALPAGHAFDSRPTAALGLLLLPVAAVEVAGSMLEPFVAALVGVLVVAAGVRVRRRSPRLGGVYRIVGLAIVLAPLLLVAVQESRYGWIELEPEPAFLATGVAVLVVAALAGDGWRRDRLGDADALAVLAPAAAVTAVLGVVSLVPPLPDLAAFLLVHFVLLGLLLVVVTVAVVEGSTALVNLVAVAFLVQVLTFLLSTVAEALSGAAALIVAGLLLLVVGLAIERGRRTVLATIRRPVTDGDE